MELALRLSQMYLQEEYVKLNESCPDPNLRPETVESTTRDMKLRYCLLSNQLPAQPVAVMNGAAARQLAVLSLLNGRAGRAGTGRP